MVVLPPIEFTRPIVSEITGTISISCWLIVFLPQIYEIYRTRSTKGLSLNFLVLWLVGDIFNLLGSVIQKLLYTVILLAAYYTLADVVLILQCLYYKKQEPLEDNESCFSNEDIRDTESILLSPTTSHISEIEPLSGGSKPTQSTRGGFAQNFFIVLSVVLFGFIAWYISFVREYHKSIRKPIIKQPNLKFNIWAQIFGYISALLYLSSRIPQICLNFKRKSCVGISLLFFLFACLGNILFVISVLVESLDLQYLSINASWLLGSSGTLLMDLTIFIQFFIYDRESSSSESDQVSKVHKSKRNSSTIYDSIQNIDDSLA